MAQVYRYLVEPPGGPVFVVDLDHSLAEGDEFTHGGWIFSVALVRLDNPDYDGVIDAEAIGRVRQPT